MADDPKPYNRYSPEGKKARQQELLDLVRKRDAANERFQEQQQRVQSNNAFRELNTYAKGGQVGKVNPFGMKNSKPDFAGGGPKTNFKMNTKKGKMPW